MVDTGLASSAALQLDGPASRAVALWRLVGALTQEQTDTLASEIKLLAGAAWPEQPPGAPRSRTAEGVRARHFQWCSSHRGEHANAPREGRHGCTRERSRPRSERRSLSVGKRRRGVTSSWIWRASSGCEFRAAAHSTRPHRDGSRWPRKGAYATAQRRVVAGRTRMGCKRSGHR